MRRRDAVHVVDFAVGGEAAVKIPPVPGGDAFGAIVGIVRRHIGAAVDVVGLAQLVGPPALRHGLALLDHARAVFLADERSGAMRQRQAANGERADPRDPGPTPAPELPPHSDPRRPRPTLPWPRPLPALPYRRWIEAGMGLGSLLCPANAGSVANGLRFFRKTASRARRCPHARSKGPSRTYCQKVDFSFRWSRRLIDLTSTRRTALSCSTSSGTLTPASPCAQTLR